VFLSPGENASGPVWRDPEGVHRSRMPSAKQAHPPPCTQWPDALGHSTRQRQQVAPPLLSRPAPGGRRQLEPGLADAGARDVARASGRPYVHVVTAMATTAAPTMLVSCAVLVDLPCPRNGQTWCASVGSPFPLLAQEILELLHQLLRVEVFVTQGARRLVTRRVIVLL
jgi:hypothetical protein